LQIGGEMVESGKDFRQRQGIVRYTSRAEKPVIRFEFETQKETEIQTARK